jgi:mannose-1-phosphate guanylyltransferase
MNKDNYCVIMAGGIGARFWPMSRTTRPKQFIDILGNGETLIQSTFKRLERICPKENIFIVTNEIYENQVKHQLPQMASNNILLEPAMRNTAPCIAYANYFTSSCDGFIQINLRNIYFTLFAYCFFSHCKCLAIYWFSCRIAIYP